MSEDLDTFDPVRGSARELVDADEVAENPNSVVLDRRRRRPRYFDGRFLSARDLSRAQQYRLLRQADLGQLSGSGIVHGLEVEADRRGRQLRVSEGMGIARSGESVVLRNAAAVEIASLRVVSGRDTSAELLQNEGSRRVLTGMFMLVARPVEHARDPGPTFASGNLEDIELEDTEFVESTWFSLIALPGGDAKSVLSDGRSKLAREIFFGGQDPSSVTDGLVLALVGLVHGRLAWIDQPMLARKVGADGVLGFGLQSRALRVAHAAQYRQQLSEVVQRRRSLGEAEGLAAREAFSVLPPVGPMPRNAIEVTTTELRQSFFPREVYVEMAIMPEDEVPALLDEGRLRAPIDLESSDEALERLPVLIVIPVPRAGFDEQTQAMRGVYRSPRLAETGRPLVRARPIDGLAVLRRKHEIMPEADPVPLDLEVWRRALESADEVWYLRRAQFASTSAMVPRAPVIAEDTEPVALLSEVARERVVGADESLRFNQLLAGANRRLLNQVDSLLRLAVFSSGPLVAGELLAPASPSARVIGDDTSGEARPNPYVAGLMGELAYLLRRESKPFEDNKRDVPRSPVFADLAYHGTGSQRALTSQDLEILALRYSSPGIVKTLLDRKLDRPEFRGVLSVSAVVPELAFWAVSRAGQKAGGVSTIAALAKAGDVEALRALAEPVRLPRGTGDTKDDGGTKDLVVPGDKDDADTSDDDPRSSDVSSIIKESLAFKRMQAIGSDDAFRVLWQCCEEGFRKRLDQFLAQVPQAGTPIFVESLQMQLIATGFNMPLKADKESRALFKALAMVREGEPFKAPNGDTGEVLSAIKSPQRDAILGRAARIHTRFVGAAQRRLIEAKIVSTAPNLQRQAVDTQRLIALASTNFNHIEAIAKARDNEFQAFARVAVRAARRSSLAAMRQALTQLKIVRSNPSTRAVRPPRGVRNARPRS